MQQAHGPPVAPGHVRRIDALGADEAGAELLHQQPEGVVGVLLHRSERDGVGDAEGADLHDVLRLAAALGAALIERRPEGGR